MESRKTTDQDQGLDTGLGREEQKLRFIESRAKGCSYARIAQELGVSKGTLTAWNTELEAEIARLRALELETLQEEFFLLKEGRIRLLGEQLKSIQAEIGKRDLSQVNTDKLLDLQLRYFGELKGEYVETGQRTKTEQQRHRQAASGRAPVAFHALEVVATAAAFVVADGDVALAMREKKSGAQFRQPHQGTLREHAEAAQTAEASRGIRLPTGEHHDGKFGPPETSVGQAFGQNCLFRGQERDQTTD